MTVRLENLTNRPVTVVLNSGAVLHLPPGHVAEPEPVEIEDNAKVRKLRDALVVGVTEDDDQSTDGDQTSETDGETGNDADAKPTRTTRARQRKADTQ